MSNRFDVEQGILSCWNITSDLDILTKNMASNIMTVEEASMLIAAIKSVYDMRFENLFNTFSEGIRNEIRN